MNLAQNLAQEDQEKQKRQKYFRKIRAHFHFQWSVHDKCAHGSSLVDETEILELVSMVTWQTAIFGKLLQGIKLQRICNKRIYILSNNFVCNCLFIYQAF